MKIASSHLLSGALTLAVFSLLAVGVSADNNATGGSSSASRPANVNPSGSQSMFMPHSINLSPGAGFNPGSPSSINLGLPAGMNLAPPPDQIPANQPGHMKPIAPSKPNYSPPSTNFPTTGTRPIQSTP